MNKKGIFFTFIIFLLAMAIIFAVSSTRQTETKQTESTIQETAFNTVNNRFENIYSEILTIKTGYPGQLQGRIITPFTYDSGNDGCTGNSTDIPKPTCPCDLYSDGCGWIEIKQTIPASFDETELKEVYDAINLYGIFISNKGISGNLNIAANPAKNTDWGGTSGVDDFLYLLLPQCVAYHAAQTSLDMQLFTDNDSCQTPFNPSDILRLDLDILVKESEGIDQICIKKTEINKGFDGSGSDPTVSIRIYADPLACSTLPPCDAMFCDYLIVSQVSLSRNNSIETKLGTGSSVYYYALDVTKLAATPKGIFSIKDTPSNHGLYLSTAKITFDKPIEQIIFHGFDFSVADPAFGDLNRRTE